MSRRSWLFAILTAWMLSLGWLVKREVFRPTGARLAAAALAVPPGALFYRLDVGNQQVGYSSTTIDTLGNTLKVENVFVLDVPAMGALHRTSARSTAILSRALRLESVETTFDGDLGQFVAHGRVLGDSVLDHGRFTGAHYLRFLGSAAEREALWNSVWISLASVVLSGVGVAFNSRCSKSRSSQ